MNYLFRTFEDVFHCLIIKVLHCSLGQQLVYFIKLICICQELFSTFFKVERRRRDLNPRAAINDLLPFQGSPFGQLGYFSKLPYLLSSSDIYLCRSQRQVILYLVSFMLSSTFLTFLKSFYSVFDKRREWDSNPRALADKRFSRPPRYDHFDISPYNVFQHFLCCFVSACCILSSNISPVNNKFDIFFKKLDI